MADSEVAESEDGGATADGPERFFFVVVAVLLFFQELEVISQVFQVSSEHLLVLLDSLKLEPVVQHLVQVHPVLGLGTHLLFLRPSVVVLLATSA